jgi:GT2 family glycosyltransferase
LTVCIVTYERPEFLQRCLTSLEPLGDQIDHVVVVDASASSHQTLAVEAWPGADYVHAPRLAGWMTRSRNEALRWASGEIIAFIDDDVLVRPGWPRALRDTFADPSVAAVSGRTCNGRPGEEHYDKPIGTVRPDGRLTDGFASLPPGPVDVDHGIGANMAFRRSVLAELGGFRDDYPGTALREDTDIFLRVRAIGGRTVFVPDAVVDHRPAPHVKGARFDTRYKLYGRRNHVVLLAREFGSGSPVLRRWAGGELRRVGSAPNLPAKARRLGVTGLGIAWGVVVLPRYARWRPLPPRRTDRAARELRSLLA